MKLKELQKAQRPRERLINEGPKALNDIELLAIILSFGSKKENVLDLSTRLIRDYGFDKLLNMTYDELKLIEGIKEAKATKLMACFEIAKRSLRNYDNNILLQHTLDVVNFIKRDYYLIDKEMITIIFVNVKNKVIKKLTFESDLSYQVEISFRLIIKEAISLNAYGIYMIHNHPSNDTRPSGSDISTTRLLYESLKLIDINLLDHIIVGKNKYYSFYENRLIINN
jgi:DNA repair protein RadC